MKCPACGGAVLIHDVRDLPYTYKGQQTVFHAIEGDYCPCCEEALFNAETSCNISELMLQFNKKVDGQFIAKVRKKLSLDQKEAAAIFGGGVNAFSRYETGKTRPPKPLIQLLQILDHHPELLPEIKTSKDLVY